MLEVLPIRFGHVDHNPEHYVRELVYDYVTM
jgi:hypothetical protein